MNNVLKMWEKLAIKDERRSCNDVYKLRSKLYCKTCNVKEGLKVIILIKDFS